MRCDERQWPFRAQHITSDGEHYGDDNPLSKLVGTGIITNHHLQGVQSQICHNLNHPTTIVEFAPDGTPVRTDSPLLTYAIHPACQRFRTFNTVRPGSAGHLCLTCDSCHARLMWGLSKTHIKSELTHNQETKPECLERLYSGVPACSFEPREIAGRVYLQYDCPLLGYRELLFPIFLEDRVVAAFFVGQITLAYRHDFVLERMASLADRFPECFDTYISSHPPITPEAIVESIRNAHREWVSENPTERILTPAKYGVLLQKATDGLSQLEAMLENELQHQRLNFIRERIARRLQALQRALPSEDVEDATRLQHLWKTVETTVEDLCKDFSFRYILVFGLPHPMHGSISSLRVVAKGGSWRDVVSELDLSALELELRDAPADYLVCSIHSHPEYLRNLKGPPHVRFGDYHLVHVPVPILPLSSIAFLVGYTAQNPGSSRENRVSGDLDTSLQAYNTMIVSYLSAILAHDAERKVHDQLLYLGHEVGQISAGLDWLAYSQFRDPAKLRRLSKSRLNDICNDMNAFNRLLYFVAAMAERLTGELPPLDVERFYPHGEILLKWKDIYRLQGEHQALQFPQNYALTSVDKSRPMILGDRTLLEQLLYNLVNNAVKYCYRGTKILIDCRLKTTKRDRPVELTVTDYGRPMHLGREVYDLHWRGEKEVPGLGIGLYIAKKIAEAHRAVIMHSSELVSPVNVPLLASYVSSEFEGKNPEIAADAAKELARLRQSGEYNSIVALLSKGRLKYTPTGEALRDEIQQPTYRVTVRVALPT